MRINNMNIYSVYILICRVKTEKINMNKKRITITLDESIIEKLQELRATCAINVSGFINQLLIKHLFKGGAK